jgi:hypothetical protein
MTKQVPGSRTPTWPASVTRRRRPKTPGGGAEGVCPTLGRRGGAAEEGRGEVEIAVILVEQWTRARVDHIDEWR